MGLFAGMHRRLVNVTVMNIFDEYTRQFQLKRVRLLQKVESDGESPVFH